LLTTSLCLGFGREIGRVAGATDRWVLGR
jgi:hypothetical protein